MWSSIFSVSVISDGTSDLAVGNHSFDFTLNLPNNLPSSLEGNHGYVRYTAKVILKRKYKIDLCYKISFTVLSHTDLNINPQMSVIFHCFIMKNYYNPVVECYNILFSSLLKMMNAKICISSFSIEERCTWMCKFHFLGTFQDNPYQSHVLSKMKAKSK